MEITLWEVTKDPSSIALELRYKDLQAEGERYYGGPRSKARHLSFCGTYPV